MLQVSFHQAQRLAGAGMCDAAPGWRAWKILTRAFLGWRPAMPSPLIPKHASC